MARSSSSSVVNLTVMDETSFEQSWSLIGGGAFGQVWKTKHRQWGFNVAIKSLGPDDALRSNEDLVKEADFMLRAGEGPYIMRVIGVFRGVVPRLGVICVGLVMEMMERGSLASLQRKLEHLLPWPLVFRLAHQVALGMNYLHCLKPDALIHKDLKPDNILLDSGLNVKITDFGLAKFVKDGTASHHKTFGTVPYMPPEALQGGATYAYDVYSYAMLLYSILHTGHSIPKFDNSTGKRPSLEAVKGMTASGLEELLDLMVKCWNQTPDQRPPFKECIAVTERLYEKHKNEIRDAVHKVQQELDGVPVVENPSGTNQDTQLKELRDNMAEMMAESRKASAELQLQKDEMAGMMVESRKASAELQLQKDNMAEMMAEQRKASAKLQLQKYEMAEMMAESRKASAELQLQKDKMAALERDNAECIAVTERLYEEHKNEICDAVHKVQQELDGVPVLETELKELRDKMAALERDTAGPSLLQRLKPGFLKPHQVDVTLDPDTAHRRLILSEDGKQVSHGDEWKNLPDNPERFYRYASVLGQQGFSSGRFYYEVRVGGKTRWDLGVARESIDRKGVIKLNPNNGYWSIGLRNGNEYKATADPAVVLPVKGKLQKVGVFVDYEEGLVSFYDVETRDDRVHLYSYTGCSFTEILFPFFNPCNNAGGKNSAPLIIHTPSMH